LLFSYSAYGLIIQADQQLPGLRNTPQTHGTADFFIYFQPVPDDRALDWRPHHRFVSRHPADQGEHPALKILESTDGRYTRLIYSEGLAFTLNQTADSVWVTYAASIPFEYVTLYLLNAVIAMCLRMRETVCLHASAVAVADRALVLVGSSGAGKSTLASYFAQRQHPVFCDDVCVLREGESNIYAQPGCPQLRLMPESTEALFGHADALTLIAEGWSKQVLHLDEQGYRFADKALPIGAVYILMPRAAMESIQPLNPTRALLMLMNNTYLDYLLDQKLRAVDMRVLARLVAHVPVRLVTPQDDIERLPDLYDHLLQDFHAVHP